MFSKFYFKQLTSLITLLKTLAEVFKKYNSKDSLATNHILAVINSGITAMNENSKSSKVSQLESVKAELVTALGGVNPYSLDKVTLRRNEMVRAVSFRCLQTLEQILRKEFDEVNAIVNDTKEQVGKIVLTALQMGLIAKDKLITFKTPAKQAKLWKDLAADQSIFLAQKQLLIKVSATDVAILLDHVIDELV